MLVTTVKELKEAIKDMEDKDRVCLFDGHDDLHGMMVHERDGKLVIANPPAIIGKDWTE